MIMMIMLQGKENYDDGLPTFFAVKSASIHIDICALSVVGAAAIITTHRYKTVYIIDT